MERGCVVRRTYETQYSELIKLVQSLAQSTVAIALSYLGTQILKLEKGQKLSQHRAYRSHSDYSNHTLNFGKFKGGNLQMLREGVGRSYDRERVQLSFDVLKLTHRVTEVTSGIRYSVTLYTPGRLEHPAGNALAERTCAQPLC